MRRGGSCVGFDQTSEVGWRRYRNKVAAGGQARDAVFAEIVGALGPNLLPMTAARDEGLAQNGDLRLGQGVAVFVGDASFNHRRGLQMNYQIFHLLACGQPEHAAFGAVVVLVDFLVAAAFDEHAIAAGDDVFDAEAAIHASERRVVSAVALALGDQLDERLLHRLAARILGDNSPHEGARRMRQLISVRGRIRGPGNSLRDEYPSAPQNNQQTCGGKLHFEFKVRGNNVPIESYDLG